MSFFKALGRLLGLGADRAPPAPKREPEFDLSARIASVVEASSDVVAEPPPLPAAPAPKVSASSPTAPAAVAQTDAARASKASPSPAAHGSAHHDAGRSGNIASPDDAPQRQSDDKPADEPRRDRPRLERPPVSGSTAKAPRDPDDAPSKGGSVTAEFNWRAALEAKGITPPPSQHASEKAVLIAEEVEEDHDRSPQTGSESLEAASQPKEADVFSALDLLLRKPATTPVAAEAPGGEAARDPQIAPQGLATNEPDVIDGRDLNVSPETAESIGSDEADDRPVQTDGGLNLGDYPEDPLIADLVMLNLTRVRLENAIGAAAKANALPLLCLSEYLERGVDAQQMFMAEVPNLGRKSALELEVLVQAAARQIAAVRSGRKAAEDKPLSTSAIRQALAALFLGRETGVMLQSWIMPTRFSNGIFNAGWLTTPFSDVLIDFPKRIADLSQQPNMGSTSITAGRQVVTQLLSEELDQRGFSVAQSASAAAALLDGRELAIVERVSLSSKLRALVAVSSENDGRETRLGENLSSEADGADEPVRPQTLSTAEILSALGALFGDLRLKEAMAPHDPPMRLQNSLAVVGWDEDPLATILADFPSKISSLRQEPNVGRVSLEAWRRITEQVIRKHLERRAFSAEETDSLVHAALDGAPLERRAREGLTMRFAGIAVSHPGAMPADVLAAFVAPPPPPLPPPADPQTLIAPLLDALDERSRDIVKRRFGLEGERETLEEIGATYQVTRERIRQLERKALRRLHVQSQNAIRSSILLHGAPAWRSLAQDGVVLHYDLGRRRRAMSPWFALALELVDTELTAWLDSYAQSFEQGWVEPGRDVTRLVELKSRLAADDLAGPRVLQTIARQENLDDVRAVLLLMGRVFYGDYVLQERPRARMRRALRLHSLLGELGKPKDVIKLTGLYRERWPDDLCAARDAEIVMEDQPRLFLEISEGFWVSLGAYGQAPAVMPAQSTEETSRQDDAEGAGEAGLADAAGNEGADETVRGAIEAELRRTGPQRISEIMERAESFLPSGRSSNSVAPILLMEKDVFARPLPGVYALHDQVLEPDALLRTRPAYLFEENQVRTYAMARRAGEPWGAYRLWRPDVEYLWCVWARKHADTELLESLLSIVEVDAWPEEGDREEWRALAATRGRYSLQRAPREEAFGLPELEHVLAACKLIESRGALSWVSANRVIFRRPADHTSAGLMAVLVALGALKEGAPDWQAPHVQGGGLEPLREELEAARVSHGVVSWNTELGQRLASRARSASLSSGWVTHEDLQFLFGPEPIEGATQASVEPLEELSFLDQLLADQSHRHEAARLESVLSDLTAVQKDET